uniref:glutathione transferase n=1 Tax=Xenopsylla cheopis TaxID=163159 RepID=A0A6M2DQM2_XENCH
MPTYKLTYFDVKGIGEPLRLLLSYGGVSFEDVRITFEQWPSVKPKTPFGVMPVLEIDGKELHQSLALGRYLGKQFGLGGKNALEDLEIDAIVDTLNDFRYKLTMAFWESDEDLKKKKMKEVQDTLIPFFTEKFEKIAKANNGHLALGRLTWADFVFAGVIEYMSFISQTDFLGKFPGLKSIYNNVATLPKVKEWIAKRPKTDL